jgi:hypothetical protein
VGPAEPEGSQTAVQAEQPAPRPAPQSGRVGQAMRIFGLRSRLLPNAAVVGGRFPGLLPAAKAVLAVGRRPVGQDGKGQSTEPAHPAADPNPVVAIVVGRFPPPAVAGDRILAAPRAPPWQERQRKRGHPGSDLSSGPGQCDKKNHGWREGPPLTVSLLEFRSVEGLHPPGIFNSNEKRILPSAVIRKRMHFGDWPVYNHISGAYRNHVTIGQFECRYNVGSRGRK